MDNQIPKYVTQARAAYLLGFPQKNSHGSRTKRESDTWSARATQKNGSSLTKSYRRFACWPRNWKWRRTKTSFLRPPSGVPPTPARCPQRAGVFLWRATWIHAIETV